MSGERFPLFADRVAKFIEALCNLPKDHYAVTFRSEMMEHDAAFWTKTLVGMALPELAGILNNQQPPTLQDVDLLPDAILSKNIGAYFGKRHAKLLSIAQAAIPALERAWSADLHCALRNM
ncbi:hypothetical protein HDK64DRAFT_251341 [Phyllosticta capitalensis]